MDISSNVFNPDFTATKTIKECPVCKVTGIKEDQDLCPQCGSNLRIFRLLQQLQQLHQTQQTTSLWQKYSQRFSFAASVAAVLSLVLTVTLLILTYYRSIQIEKKLFNQQQTLDTLTALLRKSYDTLASTDNQSLKALKKIERIEGQLTQHTNFFVGTTAALHSVGQELNNIQDQLLVTNHVISELKRKGAPGARSGSGSNSSKNGKNSGKSDKKNKRSSSRQPLAPKGASL
ncbi:MAG: hypothetical protein HQK53_11110 [Oligoflexia bacterium]|nr:hypothetical protein [Oligoflexia bacterium]